MRALALALLLTPGLASASEWGEVVLPLGHQQIFSIPCLIRIALSNGVVDFQPIGANQLKATGIEEGRTTFIGWNCRGERISILFTVRKVPEHYLQMRQILGDREGIIVRYIGERCILDGQAYSLEDMERVREITATFPDVQSLVRLAPQALQGAAAKVNQAFGKAGLRQAHAVVIGNRLVLEGSVESPEERERAQRIADAIWEQATRS